MEEIKIKIHPLEDPTPLSELDLSKPRPMFNPISYELMNPELFEDGLYIVRNIWSKDMKEIWCIIEIKDHNLVRVFKNEK